MTRTYFSQRLRQEIVAFGEKLAADQQELRRLDAKRLEGYLKKEESERKSETVVHSRICVFISGYHQYNNSAVPLLRLLYSQFASASANPPLPYPLPCLCHHTAFAIQCRARHGRSRAGPGRARCAASRIERRQGQRGVVSSRRMGHANVQGQVLGALDLLPGSREGEPPRARVQKAGAAGSSLCGAVNSDVPRVHV